MTVLGIDVSNVNGRVADWVLAKQQGCSLAIAKASEGTGFTDGLFIRNRDAARGAGLTFVAYHFLRSYPDGHQQADFFMSRGVDSNVGIMLDVEWEAPFFRSGPSFTRVAEFCDTIRNKYGRKMTIYTARGYWGLIGNPHAADLAPLVDALYIPGNPPGSISQLAQQVTPDYMVPYGGWDLSTRAWRQFGSNGNVGGINPVDMNYVSRNDLQQILFNAPPAGKTLHEQVMALPTLHYQMTGQDVKVLQHALNIGQGAGLLEDGVFGVNTLIAVDACQKFWRLIVDGVVGPATRTMLSYEVALKGQ